MARYRIVGCQVLWRELCHYAAASRHVFDFVFLPQGLHNTPDILRREVQTAIDATPPGYDAILIGYGLCSNGVQGIVARDIPLVIVKGHDCITFLLGSKERYREYFDQHPGTYWYSPGWMDTSLMPGKERYERILRTYVEKYGEDNAEYLMEMEQGWFKAYSNAAYVDLGTYDTEHYKTKTREAAEWLGWRYDELKGDSTLIERFVDGQWDDADFLVVRPGQTIEPSHDDRILIARDV
jgi:hypothetical protein